MKTLNEDQKVILEDFTDDQLQEECEDRGIWFDEDDCDCEECEECNCADYSEEAGEAFRAFYTGNEAKGVELAKALIERIAGRYL